MERTVRVDKWLWAARFFKTRSKARAAILGGKVQLDGHRVKPGRSLRIGDELVIQRGEEQFTVSVRLLQDRRGPAADAREMYFEDPRVKAQREAEAEDRARERALSRERPRRPSKRDRRKLIRFRQKPD